MSPLEMVDDVITGGKFGSTYVAFNSTENIFVELNKLKISVDKCRKIHLGKKTSETTCPKHTVLGVENKK